MIKINVTKKTIFKERELQGFNDFLISNPNFKKIMHYVHSILCINVIVVGLT